jgi:hypothetical protein
VAAQNRVTVGGRMALPGDGHRPGRAEEASGRVEQAHELAGAAAVRKAASACRRPRGRFDGPHAAMERTRATLAARVKAASSVCFEGQSMGVGEVAERLTFHETRRLQCKGRLAVQWIASAPVTLTRKTRPKREAPTANTWRRFPVRR